MYFQSLETIKEKHFSIKYLDEWLASISPLQYDRINSLIFIEVFSLDYRTGLDVLMMAVESGTLKLKYIVRSDLGTPIGTYDSLDAVPNTYLDDYGKKFNISDDNIELWFQLLDRPKYKAPNPLKITEVNQPTLTEFNNNGCSDMFVLQRIRSK